VTDYYADLTSVRSGLWSEEQFIDNLARNMETELATPEPWSVEDGSLATWIQEIYVNSSQRYYQKGSLLGLLLDISIRDATNNAHALDEVMQALFTRWYQAGKGFTTDDLLGLLTQAGMPDVSGFYQRYINGRDPLPYETVLARAGLVVRRDTTAEFSLGVQLTLNAQSEIVIERVQPGGTAHDAGIQPGDVLLKIGDITKAPTQEVIEAIRTRFRGRTGQPLAFQIRRSGRVQTVTGTIRDQRRVTTSVARADSPSAEQTRIWRGIVTGGTGE
jgi:predicted metalloprotease with PDZ domain